MPLRLHVTAHYSKCQPRRAKSQNEPGDNRVKRPLPRRIDVWMARLQCEQFATVMKNESRPGNNHSRTHTAKVALDKRNHIALGIGNTQISGVPRSQCR